jgi:hypothetical protein
MHAQKVILSHENIAHHIVSIRNENGHCICCADHIVYAVQITLYMLCRPHFLKLQSQHQINPNKVALQHGTYVQSMT